MGKLKKYFRRLRDPRAANVSYPLQEILFVALAAVLCGAKCATDMADFGRRKMDVLRQFVPLNHGVPSHDVFSDVFRTLEPKSFERLFRSFVTAFAKFHGLDLSGVLALDGKSLAALTSVARAPCRCTSSMSSRPRLAWHWPHAKRPTGTRPRQLSKSSKCFG